MLSNLTPAIASTSTTYDWIQGSWRKKRSTQEGRTGVPLLVNVENPKLNGCQPSLQLVSPQSTNCGSAGAPNVIPIY